MSYKITQLFIYPIKGLGGISLASSYAHIIGFENDRRWMLIDQNHQFITQRQVPEMAKFKTNIVENFIVVKYGDDEIKIPLAQIQDEEIITRVFDDTARTCAVDTKVDAWFSHYLKQDVKLVKLTDDVSRYHVSSQTNQKYAVSLADGYPYLLVGQSSIEYLNHQLEKAISINRFRPNIVVSTVRAHEEDNWKSITIGDAHFQNIKPCGRCQVIGIDQETAVVGFEPIKTLSQYRKNANSIYFGINLVCTQPGRVHTGDIINLNFD